MPRTHRVGLDVKVARALDLLSQRLRVPVATLERRLNQLRQSGRRPDAEALTSRRLEVPFEDEADDLAGDEVRNA